MSVNVLQSCPSAMGQFQIVESGKMDASRKTKSRVEQWVTKITC